MSLGRGEHLAIGSRNAAVLFVQSCVDTLGVQKRYMYTGVRAVDSTVVNLFSYDLPLDSPLIRVSPSRWQASHVHSYRKLKMPCRLPRPKVQKHTPHALEPCRLRGRERERERESEREIARERVCQLDGSPWTDCSESREHQHVQMQSFTHLDRGKLPEHPS